MQQNSQRRPNQMHMHFAGGGWVGLVWCGWLGVAVVGGLGWIGGVTVGHGGWPWCLVSCWVVWLSQALTFERFRFKT